MNRREFSGGLAAAAALTCPSLTRRVTAADTAEGEAARSLYARALILDCNSAPPFEGHLPLSQADLDLTRGSGINVIKLSLGGINSDFAHTVDEVAQIQQLIETHPDYFTQVRVAADMARAKRDNKLGII